MTSATPKIITRSDPSKVVIEWTDGTTDSFTATELRSLCPCARCVHELTGERMHDPATVPGSLTQSDLKMVGNYAISMQFSDGHHTGIFTFPFLRQAPDLRRKQQAADPKRASEAPRDVHTPRDEGSPSAAKDHGAPHKHHGGCNHGPFEGAPESRGE